MSGCDLISKYIVHILKPGASKIHKTHFMSDLSSLFPFLMSRIYILFVTYLLHNISRLQFRVKNKISPLDKQSLIVFLQTFNFIYSFIVVSRSCLHHTLHQTITRMAVAVSTCQGAPAIANIEPDSCHFSAPSTHDLTLFCQNLSHFRVP